MAERDVKARLEEFVQKVQEMQNAYFAKAFPHSTPPVMGVLEGKKYYKVIFEGDNRSVYGFVDKSNGDLYKAAGWAAPAKNVRGNIFNEGYDVGEFKAASHYSIS